MLSPQTPGRALSPAAAAEAPTAVPPSALSSALATALSKGKLGGGGGSGGQSPPKPLMPKDAPRVLTAATGKPPLKHPSPMTDGGSSRRISPPASSESGDTVFRSGAPPPPKNRPSPGMGKLAGKLPTGAGQDGFPTATYSKPAKPSRVQSKTPEGPGVGIMPLGSTGNLVYFRQGR